jgi:uncharacterized protein with NRDE domain
MCLIAMAWGVGGQYPLVIAANRDEAYARPTAPLACWHSPGGHSIYSGRDLQDGGTWMGFAPSGRFAMLTNVRGANPPQPAVSRGTLVVSWLHSTLAAADWCAQHPPSAYTGCNLIVGDWATLTCEYLSNQTGFSMPNTAMTQVNAAQAAINSEAAWHRETLHKGQVYGLSNAALNTPWPKTQRLSNVLRNAVHSPLSVAALQAQLQLALKDGQLLDGQLFDQERALSSVFVRYPALAPQYGTRSSLTAVLQPGQGLHLLETTVDTTSTAATVRTTATASAVQTQLLVPWPA